MHGYRADIAVGRDTEIADSWLPIRSTVATFVAYAVHGARVPVEGASARDPPRSGQALRWAHADQRLLDRAGSCLA